MLYLMEWTFEIVNNTYQIQKCKFRTFAMERFLIYLISSYPCNCLG